MNVGIIVAGVAGLLVVLIMVFAITRIQGRRQTEVEDRLGRYTTEGSLLAGYEPSESMVDEPSALAKKLDAALEDREFAKKWRIQLARADLKLTVSEFFGMHILSSIGGFLVGWLIIFGNPVGGGIAAVAGFFVPRFYVARKIGKRLQNFEGQLPDTLSLWVNALRSGYSVLQAMEAISKEAPEPTSTEFKRVVQEVQLGISMESALEHLLTRLPSEDMDLVNTAVNIQREVGGNLAEILEAIGHTIRERIKLKGEIRVLTSQGRITGWVISMLPIMLAVFLYVVSPGYMGGMVENRMCGWPMLGCGLMLIGLGTAIIQKIVKVDY